MPVKRMDVSVCIFYFFLVVKIVATEDNKLKAPKDIILDVPAV